MLSPYRSVLSIGGAPRFFASALLGRIPQGMSSLAILLLVRGATHSYTAGGAAVGAYALATAACSPLQGRLIDRFGRARVLTPVAMLQSGVLSLLVLAAHWSASAVMLVVLAGLAGSLVPSIAPAVRALLGEISLHQHVRERAYALESTTQELVWILGPLLVAMVVAATTTSFALLLLAAVCVVGTGFFVRSPLALATPREEQRGPRAPALSSRSLRLLLIPIALTGVGLGAVEVGLPSLALHAGSRSASGLLLALWSLGSMAGGLWFGSRTWQLSLSARYRTLLVAAVLLSAPLIVARSIPIGALCALLAGAAIAPLFSCQYALVSHAVSEGSATEAFTWVTSALVAGLAAGSAAGGAVISADGVAAPFVLGCLATLSAAIVAAVRQPVMPLPAA